MKSSQTSTGPTINDKELLDYFWKYFELQSNQRNYTSALYVATITILLACIVASIELKITWALFLFLGFIIVTSIIFWILFNRTTKLRDKARNYLKQWEKDNNIKRKYLLFDDDEQTRFKFLPKKWKVTYTSLYGLLFFLVIAAAITIGVLFYLHVLELETVQSIVDTSTQ